MSEKRYIIVSPSHHKKPRAMFLNIDNNGKYFWRKSIAGTIYTWLLSDAREVLKHTPIGCYIVEYSQELSDWFNDGETCKFSRFMDIVADCGNEIINNWQQVESANKASEAESEPQAETREYVVFFNKSSRDYDCGFYNTNENITTLQKATLFTRDAAHDVADNLYKNDTKAWFVAKLSCFPTSATPAPEEGKSVAYVLSAICRSGQKVYTQYSGNSIFVRIRGVIADAYRTHEAAQFAADVLNNNSDTNFGWQVELVEF